MMDDLGGFGCEIGAGLGSLMAWTSMELGRSGVECKAQGCRMPLGSRWPLFVSPRCHVCPTKLSLFSPYNVLISMLYPILKFTSFVPEDW